MADMIYSFRTRGRGPRLVAIGGGTGMSTLLRGLKQYTSNLAAVVTVADDGGSSGRLREEYRILPPGDFRQCLVALADAEPLVKQLFNHRFQEGSLNGHSFGNLFIMAMAEVTGNFEHALRESGRVLAVRGAIIPSTLHDVTLVASMNGTMVEGESKIPMQNAPITRVFLKPDQVELNPEAALAIMNAELVVVGPGSLYTSILPNLMVPGMVRTIKESPALKVFVCNVASQRQRLPEGAARPRRREPLRLRARQREPEPPAHRRPDAGDVRLPERGAILTPGALHRRRPGEHPNPLAPRPGQARPSPHQARLGGLRLPVRRPAPDGA
jgi:uncharacterized cofD-like protein